MQDKNILIVGFTNRTSRAMAEILCEMKNTVYISDLIDNEDKRGLFDSLYEKSPENSKPINLLGNQSPEIFGQYEIDMVLPSPGVPQSIPLLETARQQGIEVIGDIELFYRFFPENQYVAITGTDGKTTTTTLVYEIIHEERAAIAGGNIGTPVFEHYPEMTSETVVVLELSSFQLEEIDRFKPGTAALLNISADHLDRYDGMEGYVEAKKNIFKSQAQSDTAVLNLDCPYFECVKSAIHSQIKTFSRYNATADCYYKDGIIYYEGKEYLRRDEIKLTGVHNVENAMAAILMAKSVGISDDSIKSVLSRFNGLSHRLEFVRKIEDVAYYNDSKATTVNSLEKALLSFDCPVVLIAGGRDKGLDFTKLQSTVKEKLRALVVVGEASDKIEAALDFKPTLRAESMEDAILKSKQAAQSGDVVILSPGCTSYDMYNNFEERGDHFKKIVNEL